MALLNLPLLRTQAFINGEFVSATNQETYAVYNPANQTLLAHVANCDATQTHEAITIANRAFKAWKQKTPHERAALLMKWFDLMIAHKEELGLILALEQGKPLPEAIGEIVYGASFVQWFAEEAKRTYGEVIPTTAADKRYVTLKQPIGVCAAITPWNFPNAMITRKVAPALAAGCTMVVKPAEDTPLSALALAVLAQQAGIPNGVFNVLPTTHAIEVGKAICENPLVRKLSFTGSTQVGKILMRQCADTLKKVSFELGGNAPFIVFKDADVADAVQGAIAAKYRNAGQTCVCANAIFVEAEIYDDFVAQFTQAVQQLKVGAAQEEGAQIGPLINQAALNKVQELLQDAVEKGAKIAYGGHPQDKEGTFFVPTVLSNAQANMRIVKEEIFGPIAPIVSFETEEQVLAQVNDTEYGLAAYFYGNNMKQIWRVAEALEYGMVGINTGIISTAVAPFGGIKQSGIGREGAKAGIEEYLELKYLCFGGLTP